MACNRVAFGIPKHMPHNMLAAHITKTNAALENAAWSHACKCLLTKHATQADEHSLAQQICQLKREKVNAACVHNQRKRHCDKYKLPDRYSRLVCMIYSLSCFTAAKPVTSGTGKGGREYGWRVQK